jgi:GAF domain-containing protein
VTRGHRPRASGPTDQPFSGVSSNPLPATPPRDDHRLQVLLDASQSIVSELSLPAVLRRIVDSAREVASARYAALGVIGRDGVLDEFIHAGMDAATVAGVGALPSGRGVLGALVRHPTPIRLHRIQEDPRAVGFPPGHPQMGTFLGVPVHVRGEVFGNLYLADREDGCDFSEQDEQLLTAMAATAGIAIENARLYEESRHRQEWLLATADTSRALLRQEPPDLVLRDIASAVLRLADADLVTVVFPHHRYARPTMTTPARAQLEVRVAVGEKADELVGFVYPREGSLAGTVLDAGRPVILDHDGTRSHDEDGAVAPPLRSPSSARNSYPVHLQHAIEVGPVMACPLIGSGEMLGVTMVGRVKGSRSFTTTDLEMTQSFTRHAAIALDLAESRSQNERLVLLEDRDRIARDLHDHVIQQVFATGLSLQSAAQRAPDDLRPLIIRAVDDLDLTIRQIRETIFELQHVEPHGLAGRVATTVRSAATALGFEPTLQVDGPSHLLTDEALLADVQAVVREGLTNVARHAGATAATVTITIEPTHVTVRISDDGVGLTRHEAERRSGLANLAARAVARGGTCAVAAGDDTAPRPGTTLRWTATLAPPSVVKAAGMAQDRPPAGLVVVAGGEVEARPDRAGGHGSGATAAGPDTGTAP